MPPIVFKTKNKRSRRFIFGESGLWSKLWPLGSKNVQNFEFFAIIEQRFGKPPLSRELL